jgi:hypothetical protein
MRGNHLFVLLVLIILSTVVQGAVPVEYLLPTMLLLDLVFAFVLTFINYPSAYRDKALYDKGFHKNVLATFGLYATLSVLFYFI